MSDVKPPMSDQPKTTEIAAIPQWAAEVAKNVTYIRGNMDSLTGEFRVLQVDVRSLQQWRLDEERRRVEASTPPQPITSDRVHAIIESHPSQMDLELKAAQAAEIVKRAELEQRIKETHELALAAATKGDVKEMIEGTTAAQTAAIMTRLDALTKNPLVRMILSAIGGAITMYAASKGISLK